MGLFVRLLFFFFQNKFGKTFILIVFAQYLGYPNFLSRLDISEISKINNNIQMMLLKINV